MSRYVRWLVTLALWVSFGIASWCHGGVLIEYQVVLLGILGLVACLSIRRFPLTLVDLLLFAIVVWSLLTTLFSQVPHSSQKFLIRWAGPVLGYLAVRSRLRSPNEYARLFAGFVAVGVGLCLWGWAQEHGWALHDFWADPAYPSSRFVNHNHFSGYLEMLIPLSLGWAFFSRNRWARMGGILLAACLTLSLLRAMSRTGLLCLVAGILAFGILSFGPRRIRLSILLCLVLLNAMAGYLVFSGTGNQWKDRFESASASGFQSVRERGELWQSALNALAARPVTGFGPDSFGAIYPAFMVRYTGFACQHAHNEWLNAGAEGGLLLLILGVGLAAVLCISGLKAWALQRVPTPLLAGGLGSLLALGAHSLVDFNLQFQSQGLLFLMACALVARCQETSDSRVLPAPTWISGALAVFTFFGVAGGGSLACAWRLKERGRQESSRLHWEEALGSFQRSARFAPWDWAPRYEIGRIQFLRGRLPLGAGNALSLAEASYREGLKRNPYSLECALDLAECLCSSGRNEQAEDVFHEAQARFPRSPFPWLREGAHLLKWGRIPEAEQAFKKGLDLWDNVDVFKNSARLWSEATGESEAAGLRQILPRERFALWPILLQALGREGAWDDLAEEAQAYLQAVGIQQPQAQEDVIYAYASQGQREKGLQVLERIRSGVLLGPGAR